MRKSRAVVVGAVLLAFGAALLTPVVANAATQRPVAAHRVKAAPTAAELLAKVTTCKQISNGRYKPTGDAPADIPVCDKTGAVYWKADMDIDCDGTRTTQCNENTDCCFQPDTAFHDSTDKPLNAAQLPYVVVPSESSIWRYHATSGINGGAVVAVIYNNKVEYAVVGDTGPNKII